MTKVIYGEDCDNAPNVFCTVYVFSSHAKNGPIREMTSYVIDVP